MWSVYRIDGRTSRFAGNCTVNGYRVGNLALFRHRHSVIVDMKNESSLILTDESRLRKLNRERRKNKKHTVDTDTS